MRPVARVLRETVLTLGALAGVVSLLAVLAGAVAGVVPLVFRSGSMGPGIPTGSLGLAREAPATSVVPGEVVSVRDAEGRRVTHRVVAVLPRGGDLVALELRGDANRVPDAEPYLVTRVDRLLWSVPRLGYVVALLGRRPAVFAGGVLVGVALCWVFAVPPRDARSWGEDEEEALDGASGEGDAGEGDGDGAAEKKPADAGQRARPAARTGIGAASTVLAVGLALGGVAPRPLDTAAAFTDPAVATTGAVTVYTVPTPPVLGCTGQLGSIDFSWAPVAVPLQLVFTVGTTTGTVTTTPGQSTYTLRPALLGTGSGTVTIRRAEDVGGGTVWAADGNTRTFSLLLGLLSSCS